MLIRVFDREKNKYFISEVYATLKKGWYEKYLVLYKENNISYFKFFEYIDKKSKECNLNIITHYMPNDIWVNNIEIDGEIFSGYEFLIKQTNVLKILFSGEKVSYESLNPQNLIISSYLDGWNYINDENDIKEIMVFFSGFHDSVIKCISYISGSMKDKDGMIISDYLRTISIIFDSEWAESIEIIFEGTLALNLRPAKDNQDSNIFSASILIKDCLLYFYDENFSSIQENYDGTWIKALSMRWRIIK